ncbi:unnamed protein product, partial [Urochloa humidicola]
PSSTLLLPQIHHHCSLSPTSSARLLGLWRCLPSSSSSSNSCSHSAPQSPFLAASLSARGPGSRPPTPPLSLPSQIPPPSDPPSPMGVGPGAALAQPWIKAGGRSSRTSARGWWTASRRTTTRSPPSRLQARGDLRAPARLRRKHRRGGSRIRPQATRQQEPPRQAEEDEEKEQRAKEIARDWNAVAKYNYICPL